MEEKRITVSLPCYLRPERTKRAIQCILDQDMNNWEAFIMGDNCPHFQKLIDSGYMEEIKQSEALKGNLIHYFNAEVNGGGWGHALTNYAIQHAIGKYFIFFDNDDVILPNHFSHYLSEIENTEYSLVYYNSLLAPLKGVRKTLFQISCIGHCDVIVKTDVAKAAPPHDATYNHDINFITACAKDRKVKKAVSKDATYNVMRLGSHPIIETID